MRFSLQTVYLYQAIMKVFLEGKRTYFKIT